jgi:hypothetical protein
MPETQTPYETERLPEPTQEQIGLALEIARRALNGDELRVFSDSEGRLCVMEVSKDRIGRA